MPRGFAASSSLPRALSLTPDHIARIYRVAEDPGPPQGTVSATDADYATWVDRLIATHPAPDRPTRLFAFGSLIWRPDHDHVAEEIGTAYGWRRAFCFRIWRFRGAPEQPGLMMGLDRGGQCRGVLYQLPPDDLAGQFDRLFRREFSAIPMNNVPRWINVASANGTVPALAFVMNRASPAYCGRITLEEAARILAKACGHWGTGAEYLMRTVTELEARGICDEALWRLQHMVATRIEQG
jgi:glutathione-specific gamma-glutamylcyclotransferase